MIGIYKIISPSNKVYIGQSWNIEYRKIQYNSEHVPNQRKLYHSLKKYGFNNHKFEVVHELPVDVTQEILDQYENCYWQQYKDCGFEIMNLKEPGRGGKHSEETKLLIGKGNKGKLLGFKLSISTREKMRKNLLGNNRRNGTKHSSLTKEKMSNDRKGRIFSKEHCKNISISKSGYNNPMFGKKFSEEHKQKIANKVRETKQNKKCNEKCS